MSPDLFKLVHILKYNSKLHLYHWISIAIGNILVTNNTVTGNGYLNEFTVELYNM